jgi:hypothetical protein
MVQEMPKAEGKLSRLPRGVRVDLVETHRKLLADDRYRVYEALWGLPIKRLRRGQESSAAWSRAVRRLEARGLLLRQCSASTSARR